MFDIPLHSFIIHFPISLAILAFLYDAWAVFGKRPERHETGYALSFWAGMLSIASVVTGLQIAGLGQIRKSSITGHAFFGIATAIVLAAFSLLRYSARARQVGPDENYSMVWLGVQGLAAVLVIATAITGHTLRW